VTKIAKAPAAPAAGKKTARIMRVRISLTAEQRAEMKSLIEDGGYTQAEALAWVTEMPAVKS
jgi:hypothetical protein